MWYIYTMDSAIKRNEIGSFVETWTDLETVIQIEVSQKEKNKYINTYIWNLEKWYRWTSLHGRSRDTDVESRCADTRGRRGRRGIRGR